MMLQKVGAKQVLAHIAFSEDGYLLYFSNLQKIIPKVRMADTFPSEEEAPARKDQRKEFTADDSEHFYFVPGIATNTVLSMISRRVHKNWRRI